MLSLYAGNPPQTGGYISQKAITTEGGSMAWRYHVFNAGTSYKVT